MTPGTSLERALWYAICALTAWAMRPWRGRRKTADYGPTGVHVG